MDITYAGGASFTVKGERTIAINPSGRDHGADIVLHSARQKRGKLIVNGPGEYEIGGVLIATVETGGKTLVHAVEVDGVNIVHVGGDPAGLSERDLAVIGPVDVLLIEASDVKAAQTAVTSLTPRVIIPFGGHAAEVCATVGISGAEPQNRFSWNGVTTPAKAVLLKEPGTRRKKSAA
jgi:hypothetical protein